MRINKPLNYIFTNPAKTMCLRHMCQFPHAITGRQLSKMVKLHPTTVSNAMRELAEENILNFKRVANSHVYELNKDNWLVREALIPLYSKEDKLLDFVIDSLKSVFETNVIKKQVVSVVIFGSVVDGAEKASSDIDLFVLLKNEINPNEFEDQVYEYILKLNGGLSTSIELYVKTLNTFKKEKGLEVHKNIIKNHIRICGEGLKRI